MPELTHSLTHNDIPGSVQAQLTALERMRKMCEQAVQCDDFDGGLFLLRIVMFFLLLSLIFVSFSLSSSLS